MGNNRRRRCSEAYRIAEPPSLRLTVTLIRTRIGAPFQHTVGGAGFEEGIEQASDALQIVLPGILSPMRVLPDRLLHPPDRNAVTLKDELLADEPVIHPPIAKIHSFSHMSIYLVMKLLYLQVR